MSDKPIETYFRAIGASNHIDEERAVNDYYATNPIAIDYLLEKATLDHNIWECCCGGGSLSKRLIELGYNVKSTDLIDYGFGEGGVDFLQCTSVFDGDILTNPPYKQAQEFVEHALELIPEGKKIFMFLKVQFLEGKKRRVLFDRKQLRRVYVLSGRMSCAKNGDFRNAHGSVIAYAWYEFQKGYNGQPIIEWIN